MIRWLAEVLLGRRRRRRKPFLRFDIYVALGMTSVKLFQKGELDLFRFFERCEVPRSHDIEYLTKIRPTFTGGVEDFKPYGLIRTRDEGTPLAAHETLEQALTQHYGYGLVHLPDPQTLLRDRQYGKLNARYHWLELPEGADVHDEERFSVADMLDIIRRDLTPVQRIAWLELAFPEQPEGTCTHRYYLGQGGEVYLVRHAGGQEKRLIRAETNRAALRAVRKYIHQPDLPEH